MTAATVFYLLCLISVAASDDLQTLLQIKDAFQDSNTNSLFDSWEPNTTACEFPGITCDSNGFVKEMVLSRKNLFGSLPINTICQLKSLEKLSLGFNKLHGRVGDDLNNCSSLKYLDLGNNWFSGPFPDISSMKGLSILYANNSGFQGIFPWSSLGNMKNLQVLSLGDNSFDRTPFPREIVNLTSLNWLYLSNCSLEGEIPEEIGNLAELINFELSLNYISGEIPKGITKLSKLWQLELYNNLLTGEFPQGMQNLSNLEFLDASTNNLSGNLSEIRFLNKLISLQLFENQFSGEIPAELGDFKSLVNLSLYTNKLTGPLPQNLGSWAEFHYIDVSENLLSGPIPPDMCKKGTMVKLLMLQNNFTGEIPDTYVNCTTLIRFRVNKNGLSGRVPGGIWGLPQAQIIDVANNDFEGPVTSDIMNAKSLGQLFLSNNRLSGEFPPEISKASSLVSIDLSNNQFSGELPATIGELNQLTSLYLQGNNFSGSIPDSLGLCRSINDINIAQNKLSGSIPASLGSLPTLNFLNLSRNQLSGPIPGSLSGLRLNLLDLSQNRLSGPIPVSLLTAANNGSFSGNNALCSDNVRSFRLCSRKPTTPHIRTVLLCLIMVCVALIALLVGFCYVKRKGEERVGERSLKDDSWLLKSFHVLTFTEDEILDSIKQENVVGKGGSGNVYRVVVGNGKELAVKHIWHSDECSGTKKMGSSTPILARREPNNQKSREFEAEAQTLSSIRHINVVKLYCSISSEDSSLLVYEYMPNGSLWDRLHNCKKLELDWEQRYDIALGSAKGLEYLHHGCDRPVIHRDVKSSNILLDEHLKPRIADFGLAKILQAHSTMESTQIIAGTHGYIAPEYGYTNKVNEKSDLYSFGVVLMELVTGKRPIEAEFGENKDIVDWVLGNLKTKELRGKTVYPDKTSASYLSFTGNTDRRVELDKNKRYEDGRSYYAALSIMAAKASYENHSYIQSIVNNHWEMDFLGSFDFWNDYQDKATTQAFILQDKNDVVMVSFRGTETFDADAWSSDVDISWYELPVVGKVHGGFLKALGLQKSQGWPQEQARGKPETTYYAVRRILKERLQKNDKARFVVAGHSLGGALAVLFPAVLALHGETWLLDRLRGIYTFGQPRVGDDKFKEYMEGIVQKHGIDYYRIVYGNDVVPRLPYDDSTLMFKHFGTCVYYNSFYQGKVVGEEPNKNYFSIIWVIPKVLNACWELIRSFTMGHTRGADYEEGGLLRVLRVMGLLVAGIPAHMPQDYVNATRLGDPQVYQTKILKMQ